MPIVTDELELDFPEFDRTFRKFARLRGNSLDEEFETQARGVLKRAIEITPPFNQQDRKSTAAKKRGERKILRDLERVFAPVDLKGSRQITHVFGHRLETPIEVPTQEKPVDIPQTHKKYRSFGKRNLGARTRRAKEYVSERKLMAYYRQKKRDVGYLGGGWAMGARRLNVRGYPAWMRRHAGKARGSIEVDLKPPERRIRIRNRVDYGTAIAGLGKRIAYAVEYQRKAMERQIPYLIRKAAREARFADASR